MTKYVEKYEGVILPHISCVSDTMWLHIKHFKTFLITDL